MDFFSKSWHCAKCIYSLEDIVDCRTKANEAGGRELVGRAPHSQPLTVEEETALLRHYQLKIPEICRYFAFPRRVVTTAHWILARVSLRHSAMQHDPKHTMLACVLLATKLEDLHLTMEQYADKIPKTDKDLLMSLEFVLLAALEYRVFFFSPHPCLVGIMLELRALPEGQKVVEEHTVEAALECLEKICTTDAVLLYSPLRLAAIAVTMTLGEGVTREYFEKLSLHSRINEYTLDASLKESVAVVERLMAEMRPDTQLVKSTDRHLIQLRKAH